MLILGYKTTIYNSSALRGKALVTDRQATKELEVFQSFASVCDLCIVPDSIEKRYPPEPDIFCGLQGGGGLAFEMVRLIDRNRLARRLGDQEKLERHFEEYCRSLPDGPRDQLQARIGNARIFVRMQPSCSLAKRMRAVPGIVQQLLALDSEFRGKLTLPSDLARVASVKILRGARQRYLFHVEATSFFDPVPLDAIEEKFDHTYQSSAPMELLAYFNVLGAPPQSQLGPLYKLIEERWPSSCFSRVWVFDATAQRIYHQSTAAKQKETLGMS